MTAGTGHTKPLLTPFEVSFTRWVGKHPVAGVIAFTLLFIGISTGMSFIGIALWGPENISPSGERVTYSIAVAIPLTMSPITFGLFARLLTMLDRSVALQTHHAATDALTGILNRRGFHKASSQVRKSCALPQIAMIDVDDFKLINDEHGHEFGDKALVAIAEWLTQQTGESGIAARVGGDEFVFLGEETSAFKNSTHELEVEGVPFSISIGTTPFGTEKTLAEGLAAADQSLYRIKKRKHAAVCNHRKGEPEAA